MTSLQSERRAEVVAVATAPELPVTSDLFVVSNLGQIRTAALVVRQLELETPHLLVLWTRANRQLLRTMTALATKEGLQSSPVELAPAPNVPLPGRIRRMVDIVDRLPARFPAARLWLCNANSFYGYLAVRYAETGAGINLFEEGLGSYHSHLDPPFARERLGRRVHQLAVSIRSIIGNPQLGRYRKLRRIGHHTARLLAQTDLGERVNVALEPNARYFQRPWTTFDRALMAFPDAVDPVLVQAARLERLDVEPEAAEITRRERVSGPVEIAEPLLLSQRYGVPYQPWAEAIAASLRGRGIEVVALKHHPRETDRERADLTLALMTAGLIVRDDPDFDDWTAEALVVESGVRHVVGITSSTLVYRPRAPQPVTYTSIGREVLQRLEQDRRVHRGSLVQLSADVSLLERVYGRLDR